MTDERIRLADLLLGELADLLAQHGHPPFRARQVYEWIHRRYATDFAELSNVPKGLRETLAAVACLRAVEPVAEQASSDGNTFKCLFRLNDGQTVESVLMRQPAETGERRSVCVSTQVGCPVRCAFCATGRSGFVRQLSAGEIVGQVLYFARQLATSGVPDPITNVVFMGQGEPLLNRSQTRKAVELLNSADGFNLGARHMTISTAGVVPGIQEMAEWPWQVGLAVSLHSPNDELRNRLVPINHRYPVGDILEACDLYVQRTRRRVTFEYAMIKEVNDSTELAAALADRLHGRLCHVNLIPLNAAPELPFAPSARRQVLAFQAVLTQRGIPCTVRVERGADIAAACGQLRRRTTGVNGAAGRPEGGPAF